VADSLDVIIVSYNARADLEACLASIHGAPPGRPHTIVVVDNASRDGSADAVAEHWPQVRLIRNPRNVGFAAANNIGIRASSGALVLLLNSDTIVPAGALDRLADALERHPRAAIAGPRLVDGAGTPEISFGGMLGPWNELRQRLLGALYAREVPAVRRWVARRVSIEHWPDWVSGACLLVRRTDAEAAGLLDERYFMYGEDVDFCAAVRARGRGVLFTPDAEVVHLRGRSRASAPEATRVAYRRSQVAFYAKHHPAWAGPLRLYLRLKGELPHAPGEATGPRP
jgi:hypothetical protein